MDNLTHPRPEIKQAAAIERRQSASQIAKKSPLFVTLALALAVAVSLLAILNGSHTQAKYNNLLKNQSALQESVQKLELENKVLTDKIEKAEKEKDAIQSNLENLKKDRESLDFQLKKAQSKLGSTAEEKGYLEEILINKNKELEKLKQQAPLAASVASGSASLDDLASKLAEKDKQIQALNEQNSILQSKLEKIYKTASDKIAALNDAKSSLESTLSEAKKTIDSEFNTIDLGSISVANQASAPAAAAPAQTEAPQPAATAQAVPSQEGRRAVKTQGKILAINSDHGFVVIDMGKVDGVTNKSWFQIKSNSGEIIGSLNVLEIRDVMTACSIQEMKPGSKIEINDTVLIQK